MTDWIVALMLLAGALLRLLAAVGIVRFPDVFTRLHAAAKAGSLGLVLIVAAVAVHFAELGVTIRALLVLLFVTIMAPIAAQTIARCAYLVGYPTAPATTDELERRTDRLM